MKKYGILFVFLIGSLLSFGQKKNGLIRLMDQFYRIMEGDSAKPKKNHLFLIPIFDVTPETGIKIGVSAGYLFRMGKTEGTRPSMVRLNTSYTEENQFNIRPSADLFFDANRYHLKTQYVYNDFNEYYWGVGNSTAESAKELYDFKQHKFNFRFTRQVIKNVYLGGQVIYEKIYDNHFNQAGSTTSRSGVTGINGYENYGAGLAFAFDNRDKIYFPLSGAYLEISNYFYLGHKSNSVNIDIRKYFGLWKENVFAIQGFLSVNDGDVPYRQMGVMGNEMIMRGYYNGRFRDKHFAAIQGEMRKTIWGPLGLVVFGGAGNVGTNADDIFKNIKPNYGFGFRGELMRREHINARFDMGFGEGKIKGIYITMAESF